MPPPFSTTASQLVSPRSDSNPSHLSVVLAVTLSAITLGASVVVALALRRRIKTKNIFQMPKSPVNLNVDVSVDVYTVMSQDKLGRAPYFPAKDPLCITTLPQIGETCAQLSGSSSLAHSQCLWTKHSEPDLGLSLPEMSPCSPFMFLGGLNESSSKHNGNFIVSTGSPPLMAAPETPELRESLEIYGLSNSPSHTHGLFGQVSIFSRPKSASICGDLLDAFLRMDVDALVLDFERSLASGSRQLSAILTPRIPYQNSVAGRESMSPSAGADRDLDTTDKPLHMEDYMSDEPMERNSITATNLVEQLSFSNHDDSGYVDCSVALLPSTGTKRVETDPLSNNGIQTVDSGVTVGSRTVSDDQDTISGLPSSQPTDTLDDLNKQFTSQLLRTPSMTPSRSVSSLETSCSQVSIASGSSMTLTTCCSPESVLSQSPQSSKAGSPATGVGRILQPLFESLVSLDSRTRDSVITIESHRQSLKSHLSISSLQSAFTLHSPSSQNFSTFSARSSHPSPRSFKSPSASTPTPLCSPSSRRMHNASFASVRSLRDRIPGITTTRTPRHRQRSRSRSCTPTCPSSPRSFTLSCTSPSASLYHPERPSAPTPGSFLSRLSLSPSTSLRPSFYITSTEGPESESCFTTPRAGYPHSPQGGLQIQFPDMLASPYLRPSAPTPGSLRSRLSVDSVVYNSRGQKTDSQFLGISGSPAMSYLRTPSPSIMIPDSQLSTPLVELSVPSSVQMSDGSFEDFSDTPSILQQPPSPNLSPVTFSAVSPLSL